MSEDSQKRYNNILNIIDKRLIPDAKAKAARGEVFTPLNLVREMLFGIRKSALKDGNIEIWGLDKDGAFFDDNEDDRMGGIDLKLWRNEKTTFLDPANGIGNFPVVAFYMLDYQIGKHGKPEFRGDRNKEKRRKHIIENQLFMIELNKGNVNTARKIFNMISPNVKSNICCTDTEKITDVKMKEIFGINRFDIIMGNPPFQDEGKSGGKNKLYERITSKYIDLYNEYMIFLTPDNIFSGNSLSVYRKILTKNTELISFKNIQKIHFPSIGQSMCYFKLSNTKYTNTMIISNTDYNLIELKDRSVNPVKDWTIQNEKLFKKYIQELDNNFIYNRGTSESDYTGGKYTVISKLDEKLKTNNPSLAKGYGLPKLILFEMKPKSDAFYDSEGEYGVGPHTFYLEITNKQDGMKLFNFFKSENYKKLVELSLTSQYLKLGLLGHLNIVNIVKNSNINTSRKSRNNSKERLRKTRKYRK